MKTPVHPGTLLKERLKSANIKIKFLAQKIHVSNSQLVDILNGKRRLTPKIALYLEKELGFKALEWVRLQAEYELEMERLEQNDPFSPEDRPTITSAAASSNRLYRLKGN